MIAGSAFRHASNAGLRSYGWGVVSCGAFTLLALQQMPGLVELFEEVFSPRLFVPILIGATLFYGTLLACSTRESHRLKRFLIQQEFGVLRWLSRFCGYLFGWALVVCLAHIIVEDSTSTSWAAILASYTAILTLFPILTFSIMLVVSKSYREFTIREKNCEWLIVSSGWALIAFSIFYGYRMTF